MLLILAVISILIVIILFILDSNEEPLTSSRVWTYFRPFYSETIVKHDYSVKPENVWKALTALSRYNVWFPGVVRFMPVVESNRYVHRYSFDQHTLEPGAFIRLRPFGLSPAFKGRIMSVEKNKQLAFELKFNPFHKELVLFDLEPIPGGTGVTCRRSSAGIFSFLTLWGFSSKKSKILDNLGFFIPEEKEEEKIEAPTAEKEPSISREAIIAKAVEAALGGNMDLINAIPDKPTRGLAKGALVKAKRGGGVLPDHLQKALSEKPSEPALAQKVSDGSPGFANSDDLIAYVINKALDGDDEPLNGITEKVIRGKAKAMLIKIKRGTVERPPMPPLPDGAPAPQEESSPSGDESEEALFNRLVDAGVNGNMDEINAIENRVLRGKIKAAIVKAKRAKKV